MQPPADLAAAQPGYPATLSLDAPAQVARWRPLVHWILVIPQLLVLYGLQVVSSIIVFICFFAVLFTRRVPDGLYDFQVMVQRYAWRAGPYLLFMHERYPPLDFAMGHSEPGQTPSPLALAPPAQLNRWLPLVKWLLSIPHQFVLFFLAIAAMFALIFAWFAVLITGRFPTGVRTFLVGVARWNWRLNAYMLLLRDEYPPFRLAE